LKGSEYVIDPEKIGYETCAYIGLYLKDPSSFDDVMRALENIQEVVECHFTTGQYDMFIKIYAKNNSHLLSVIHDKLQPLGLARTETLISFHEAIKRQMPILDIETED
jgi:transcriptional regulator, AsnC family